MVKALTLALAGAVSISTLIAGDCFVTPGGAGDQSGKDPQNARPAHQLQLALDALKPGETVFLGSGTYTNVGLRWSGGGTTGQVKTLAGMDTGSGFPMFRDTFQRTDPKRTGGILLSLSPGVSHVAIRDLRVDGHATAVKLEGRHRQVRLQNITAQNMRDAFWFEGGGIPGQPDSGTRDVEVRHCVAERFTKRGFRIVGGNSHMEFSHCRADAGGKEWGVEVFPIGFHVLGGKDGVMDQYITFTDCVASHAWNDAGNRYWNGDGFAAESQTAHLTWVRCYARENTDGGWDVKSRYAILRDCVSIQNKRNFRVWASGTDAIMENCLSAYATEPKDGRPGLGLWLQPGSTIRVTRCTFWEDGNSIVVEDGKPDKPTLIKLSQSLLKPVPKGSPVKTSAGVKTEEIESILSRNNQPPVELKAPQRGWTGEGSAFDSSSHPKLGYRNLAEVGKRQEAQEMTPAAEARHGTQTRPNILFILSDDQGWPTLGCYGNKLVPTPHLDSLASDGIRFTDAYVTPQCTPTRAALLTGQHTARNGMWHVIPGYGYPFAPVTEPEFRRSLARETFTLAKGLKKAGYATACIGKWHLTSNNDGDYVGLKPETAEHYGFDFSPAPPSPRYHQMGDKGVDWLTGQAIDFMEKNRQQPWFIYLAHHTVHGPVVAPEPLVAKYRDQGHPETGLNNATYLAALEHLDRSIGRLLAKADGLSLRQNTIVIFLSDNGGVFETYATIPERGDAGAPRFSVERREFSNAPLRSGKGSAYEGGLRVPCLVRWPGHARPGTVSSIPIHVVDWAPTLLEIAGAHAPDDHVLDGTSLVPLLRGGTLATRPLYWYLPLYDLRWGATPCGVIREGDWKLIATFGDWVDKDGVYRQGKRLELYNLRLDLGETRNLADTDVARAEKMSAMLFGWIKSVPAVIPAANPNHQPARSLEEVRMK